MSYASTIRFCLVLALSALAVGCSDSLKFIVVDADTLKPIYGVHTIVDVVNTEYFSSRGDEVSSGPITDGAGEANLFNVNLGQGSETLVEFYCEGYYEAGFAASSGRDIGTIERRVPNSEDQSGEIHYPAERASDGAIVIKLKRALDGEEDVALYNWGDDPRRVQRIGNHHQVVTGLTHTLPPQGVKFHSFP